MESFSLSLRCLISIMKYFALNLGRRIDYSEEGMWPSCLFQLYPNSTILCCKSFFCYKFVVIYVMTVIASEFVSLNDLLLSEYLTGLCAKGALPTVNPLALEMSI
jgi:hypothetical protein